MTSVPAEDGYAGPAQLIPADGDPTDAEPIEVSVVLRGRVDPISGRYSWYGRVAADPSVARLVESGGRTFALRTPHGEVVTGLTDVDPWGRPRVEGVGAAPFPVLDALPTDA